MIDLSARSPYSMHYFSAFLVFFYIFLIYKNKSYDVRITIYIIISSPFLFIIFIAADNEDVVAGIISFIHSPCTPASSASFGWAEISIEQIQSGPRFV